MCQLAILVSLLDFQEILADPSTQKRPWLLEENLGNDCTYTPEGSIDLNISLCLANQIHTPFLMLHKTETLKGKTIDRGSTGPFSFTFTTSLCLYTIPRGYIPMLPVHKREPKFKHLASGKFWHFSPLFHQYENPYIHVYKDNHKWIVLLCCWISHFKKFIICDTWMGFDSQGE